MSGDELADAIDSLPPDRRRHFELFLSGWLIGELRAAGVDVDRVVFDALRTFETAVPA